MVKTIITDADQLHAATKPLEFLTENGVIKDEGLAIIADIKDTMLHNNCLALSAPQIGIDARIFCIRFKDTIKSFINPIVTKKTGSIISPETSASMPGKEILIARPEEVTIVYYNEDFEYEDNKLLDAAARLFDQQCNYLDGVTPDELGLISDVDTDGSLADLTDEEAKQLAEIYKNFIQVKMKNLQTAIEDSPEMQKVFDRLRFTEDVINGRTLVVNEDEAKQTKQFKQTAKMVQAKKNKAESQAALKKFLSRKH